MAYTPPNAFTATTTMTANEIANNNTAIRTYMNIAIIDADVTNASVSTIDIVRGEFYGVTNDHQFTTGDMYTQFVDLLRTNEKYWSSHIKPYDLTGPSPYHIVAESGKRVVLEHPADVLYSVAYLGVGNPNIELAPQRLRNPGYVGHTTGDTLRTSDIDLCTAGHSYTEDAADSVPAPYVLDADDSGNITTAGTTPTSFGLYCRRWYCQRSGFVNLPAGVHHFYVAMNPRCDKGHIKVLMSEVEVFFRKQASQQ